MTKLPMHESLPFDEETTPPPVSTGELPQGDEVRDAVTEAYERYRTNGDGAVADYIPVLAGASPEWFGISVVGARGRSFEIGDVETTFSIQSVSKPFVFALVCEAIGYDEARRRLGVNSTGFPFDSLMAVELNVDRTMNPLVNAGAMATTSLVPGDTADEKWERIQEGLSRFAGRQLTRERGGLRLRVRHQPAQPRHRPSAARATVASTSIPTRPPRSTPASARSRCRSTTLR